jgi:hypothetical protein
VGAATAVTRTIGLRLSGNSPERLRPEGQHVRLIAKCDSNARRPISKQPVLTKGKAVQAAGSTENDEEFARLLERRTNEKTEGRISGLRIDVCDTRFVVRGHTWTHYVKQLALKAISELNSSSVDLDIHVGDMRAGAEE